MGNMVVGVGGSAGGGWLRLCEEKRLKERGNRRVAVEETKGGGVGIDLAATRSIGAIGAPAVTRAQT